MQIETYFLLSNLRNIRKGKPNNRESGKYLISMNPIQFVRFCLSIRYSLVFYSFFLLLFWLHKPQHQQQHLSHLLRLTRDAVTMIFVSNLKRSAMDRVLHFMLLNYSVSRVSKVRDYMYAAEYFGMLKDSIITTIRKRIYNS